MNAPKVQDPLNPSVFDKPINFQSSRRVEPNELLKTSTCLNVEIARLRQVAVVCK
jgi:hypothetical protein